MPWSAGYHPVIFIIVMAAIFVVSHLHSRKGSDAASKTSVSNHLCQPFLSLKMITEIETLFS